MVRRDHPPLKFPPPLKDQKRKGGWRIRGRAIRKIRLLTGDSDDILLLSGTWIHTVNRHLSLQGVVQNINLAVFCFFFPKGENHLGGLTCLWKAAFYFFPEVMTTEAGI